MGRRIVSQTPRFVAVWGAVAQGDSVVDAVMGAANPPKTGSFPANRLIRVSDVIGIKIGHM